MLVGVTSKDHWDHLNQNPRLKALEFVASKSRKVMPAQEENEDRFCPAGWKKLVWKWWKHWLSERSKYMLDVFVCFSWMKVLTIPSNFLLFFQFPCSHLKRNVGSLIQFFLHLFVTYIYIYIYQSSICCFILTRTPIFVGGEFGQGRAVRFLEGDRVLCRVEAPGGLTTWEEGVVIGLWYREPCFNFKKARGLVGCFFVFLKNLGETTSLFSLVGCSWSLRNMLLRYYLDNCSQFL